jgi:hypothetical protein
LFVCTTPSSWIEVISKRSSMKKIIFCCLILAVSSTGLLAQNDSLLPTLRSPHHVYAIPKAEAYGAVMALSYLPLRLAGESFRQAWPAWIPVSVEVGITPRTSLIGGFAGRYSKVDWSDGASSPYFRNAWLKGAKFSLGFRHYLTCGNGQGFYIQPTAKLVWQSYFESTREGSYGNANRDFIFSTRLGWQKRLVRQLHLDVAVGPGLGVRDDLTHDTYGFAYYFGVGMGEIDNPSVVVIDAFGPNWTSVYLIGDASLALGWKF